MNSIEKCLFSYGPIVIGAILFNLTSDLGGIYGSIASLIGIYLSRSITFLFLSFINFSLSIAFDNFIRADPHFYFYDGSGTTASYLCLISTLIYCAIGIIDVTHPPSKIKGQLIHFKAPTVSPALFWPLVLTIIITAFFIIINGEFILSASYDAYELQKYPFLEYISLVIAFTIQSTRGLSRRHRLASYWASIFYISICLATSYRMVAIICSLSLFMMTFNGRIIRKHYLVLVWLCAYVGLTYISYWRIGHYNIDISNIFGYINGRMDNTFTGVIETALIYTSIAQQQSLSENFIYMIGALLPIPNSFIPDQMLYIVDAAKRYHFPGGGALAGFVIYFNYTYLAPYLTYIYLSFKYSHRGNIFSWMYLITFITITRWWLYGPYVIFKFLGILTILMITNKIFRATSKITRSSSRTKEIII